MTFEKVTIGPHTLYRGDCLEVLPTLEISRSDVVVMDPPWDQAKGISGSDDPRGLFASIAPFISKARMAVVQLGCYTDPCFLSPLAKLMPFFHCCWLRYMPPSYNGRVLVDADVAYAYGKPPRSQEGRRVIPSMPHLTVGREGIESEYVKRHGKNRTSRKAAETVAKKSHPMPRLLSHVRWLVRWHSDVGEKVYDPTMGSGTTGIACVQTGRVFVGIEVDQGYFQVACRRIEEANGKGSLFEQVKDEVDLYSEVKT